MLTQEQLCRTYDKFRLQMCRSFPIDQRDIHEVARCGGNCGYRFEKLPLLSPPFRSFQADLSKRVEGPPVWTASFLSCWLDTSITRYLTDLFFYSTRKSISIIWCSRSFSYSTHVLWAIRSSDWASFFMGNPPTFAPSLFWFVLCYGLTPNASKRISEKFWVTRKVILPVLHMEVQGEYVLLKQGLRVSLRLWH